MSDAANVRPLRAVEWVAARLGVSRWQVYELAKRGALPQVKLGRLVRFDEDAIEAFIRRGGTTDDDGRPEAPPAPHVHLRLRL